MRRLLFSLGILVTLGIGALPVLAPLGAQRSSFATAGDARAALDEARIQQRKARARGERLEARAARSRAASDKALQQAAALAARVQQAEAAVAVAEARLALIGKERRALDATLARKREPLARLAAALQTMARRPTTLVLFQRGSLRDLVHTRAILGSAAPLVATRTAGIRGDLERARALEGEAATVLADRREAETALGGKRRSLLALAAKERATAANSVGDAGREAERALALSERARDLDMLVGEMETAGALRRELAALPGPILRPGNPVADLGTAESAPLPTATPTAPPAIYQLPVEGRLVGGFNEAARSSGARRPGIAIAPRPAAQVVAPAAGRIAFAGPYRGYGMIVIVEHANGWTSLVTGLANLDVAVGQQVTAGSPIGRAARSAPEITLELRRAGEPVNPLDLAR